MVGGAPDRLGPAALALGQLGGLQQLRQRQDAGQRGANVMRQARERDLDRARAWLAGALCSRPALAFRHENPNPGVGENGTP